MSRTLTLNSNSSFPCMSSEQMALPLAVEHLPQDHVQQKQGILDGVPLEVVVNLIRLGLADFHQNNVQSKILLLHGLSTKMPLLLEKDGRIEGRGSSVKAL